MSAYDTELAGPKPSGLELTGLEPSHSEPAESKAANSEASEEAKQADKAEEAAEAAEAAEADDAEEAEEIEEEEHEESESEESEEEDVEVEEECERLYWSRKYEYCDKPTCKRYHYFAPSDDEDYDYNSDDNDNESDGYYSSTPFSYVGDIRSRCLNHEEYDPISDETFHPFPRLPTEIQVMIFKYALAERQIASFYPEGYPGLGTMDSDVGCGRISPLFFVNHLSRMLAEQRFPISFRFSACECRQLRLKKEVVHVPQPVPTGDKDQEAPKTTYIIKRKCGCENVWQNCRMGPNDWVALRMEEHWANVWTHAWMAPWEFDEIQTPEAFAASKFCPSLLGWWQGDFDKIRNLLVPTPLNMFHLDHYKETTELDELGEGAATFITECFVKATQDSTINRGSKLARYPKNFANVYMLAYGWEEAQGDDLSLYDFESLRRCLPEFADAAKSMSHPRKKGSKRMTNYRYLKVDELDIERHPGDIRVNSEVTFWRLSEKRWDLWVEWESAVSNADWLTVANGDAYYPMREEMVGHRYVEPCACGMYCCEKDPDDDSDSPDESETGAGDKEENTENENGEQGDQDSARQEPAQDGSQAEEGPSADSEKRSE
ncbi:hypothetical protein F5Y17DRAFT_29087 [Xylariaceae sp. FL0594]|nr:hypothetical protein F5Y17DRAFT_29087 [Xylariaceae sp. FL0594]